VAKKKSGKPSFNLVKYLETAGVKRRIVRYRKSQAIFSQGEDCRSVQYLQKGSVKISVISGSGKEAIVGLLAVGDFFGEGSIAGQVTRTASAIALEDTDVLEIDKKEMIRMIREEPEFAERFVAHMLKRNVRIEEDLVDQLFNSSEKRLARVLLLAARYGNEGKTQEVIAELSQETLAEMIGTTRSRVSFFMNKFRKLGFIKYNGGLHIYDSLLNVVLRD
jgi:CRP/FNR family transcriptional regulator, cyclic AMP receptor protein